jgi:hypothetical protein
MEQGFKSWNEMRRHAARQPKEEAGMGAKVASAVLRDLAGRSPQVSRNRPTAAADSCARIEQHLQPAFAGEGAGSYQRNIGDFTKQTKHAEHALRLKGVIG